MKVLYIGSLKSTACATFYRNAMLQMDFDVECFDPKYFSANSLFEKLMVRARKGPSTEKVNTVSKELVQLCRENSFDAVFVMAENFLSADTIDEIKHLGKSSPLFIYHSHDNNFAKGICKPKGFFETLTHYDFVFTTKSQNVKRYQDLGQKNSYFIPSAFDPNVHHPIDKESSLYGSSVFDVSFIGTYDHSRNPYLDAVGWERLYVWGNGWKKSPAYNRHRDHIVPHAVYLDEFADVLSHSKCSLGLLREEAEDLHTQRTFEIPVCGTLQIAPRNDEILTFFDEGKEIVCFSSIEELKEKVDYYLAHDTERKKIIENGMNRCHKDGHTYLDRVMKMFEIAGAQSGRWSSQKSA